MSNDEYRGEQAERRQHGLKARHEQRLENATYTAAEVKVLTEAALRLGRKEAGEDIARTAEEIAEGCSQSAKVHRQASIDATTDRKKRSHMQTALSFTNQAAGAWAVAEFARDYPYEALADASEPRTDPSMGMDLPPEPQAVREPHGGGNG